MTIMIIIVLILIFLTFISSTNDSDGVILFFANIGSGKTTKLSQIAIREIKRIEKGKSNYKYVVSNAKIDGVIYIEDLRELLKRGVLQDTLLLVDEGSIVYNNRKMDLKDIELFWFKMIRHYRSSIVVLSQSYSDIDVTIRRLYSQLYIMNRLPLVTLIRPIKRYVGIDETTNQIVDKYKFAWIFSWRFFIRPVYFKYFDSWWIPSNVFIHDLSKYAKEEFLEKKEKRKKIKFRKVKIDDEDSIDTL